MSKNIIENVEDLIKDFYDKELQRQRYQSDWDGPLQCFVPESTKAMLIDQRDVDRLAVVEETPHLEVFINRAGDLFVLPGITGNAHVRGFLIGGNASSGSLGISEVKGSCECGSNSDRHSHYCPMDKK